MTKDQIIELFLKDLRQPLIEMALHRSFRRWATLRDQLIQAYSSKTGIPEEEFHTAIALDNYRELSGSRTWQNT